jgi:putative addiction module component (TIGR02574 family)
MSTISEVYQAALSLSADERSKLAHHLLLSLEPDEPDHNVNQDWAEEVQRRRQSILEDPSRLSDWDEALAEIRREIGPKDPA